MDNGLVLLHIVILSKVGLYYFIDFTCKNFSEKGCEALLDPDYGHVQIIGSDVGIVGSQAHYTCDIGFVITKGNKVRTCQHNYIWSGSPAVCERTYPLDIMLKHFIL